MSTRTTPAPRRRSARVAVIIAASAGLLHAASSFYWAFGGDWLLSTVGEWAVEAMERSPVQTGLLLAAIGIVKLLAAIIPVGVDLGRIPFARFWRVICWIGGPLLVAYGAVNVAVSGAVLAGLVRPAGGYDVDAMVGHAFLWDPLFLIWGAALLVWLRLSAKRPAR